MLNVCYTFVKHQLVSFIVPVFQTLLYNCAGKMKFRRREKQIGIRLRADQHTALREIAEREGYDSVSEFVRILLEKAIEARQKKRTVD